MSPQEDGRRVVRWVGVGGVDIHCDLDKVFLISYAIYTVYCLSFSLAHHFYLIRPQIIRCCY